MTAEIQAISAKLAAMLDRADEWQEATGSTAAANVVSLLDRAIGVLDDCAEFYAPDVDKQMAAAKVT
jgi:hypothetical protein